MIISMIRVIFRTTIWGLNKILWRKGKGRRWRRKINYCNK